MPGKPLFVFYLHAYQTGKSAKEVLSSSVKKNVHEERKVGSSYSFFF
jgi:hypothetical protein